MHNANARHYEGMDSKTIRLANLRLLISRAVTQAALARQCGTDPSLISQITMKKARRAVGDELARTLERGTGMPHGWLDVAHPDEWRDAGIDLPDSAIVRLHRAEGRSLGASDRQAAYRLDAPDILQRLPIIGWDQVTKWLESPFQTEYSVPIWRRPGAPARQPYSDSAFALMVENDRWAPEIPEGTALLIDPQAKTGHKGWVLVRLPGQAEPTLLQAVPSIDPDRPHLKSVLGSNAPAEPWPSGAEMIGRVAHALL